jgi:drug/metabolite transporter (DMT)-like permease
MESLPFVVWRAGIGAIVLIVVVAVAAARGRPVVRPWRLARRQQVTLAVATLMGLLLNMAIFAAFSRVTIAIALLALYTYPAMVAVVAIALGRERPSRATLLALVLALAGMTVVVAGGLDPTSAIVIDGVGVLLALGAAAAQTVFVTISRDGYRSVPADQAMTVILVGSAIGGVIVALAVGAGPALAEPLRQPELIPIVLAAGTLGAGISSLMFLTGIRLIGGTRTGILMLLEPVVALVLAALLLGEPLRPIQLVGAAAILGAALLLQRSTRRGEDSAAEAAASRVPGGP